MAEHTPGPWFIGKKGGPFCVDAPCGGPDEDFRIAKTYASPFSPDQKQSAANARLIAAAPDLYALARSLRDAGAAIGIYPLIDRAAEILARIEGRDSDG